jgi:hypothetical protein
MGAIRAIRAQVWPATTPFAAWKGLGSRRQGARQRRAITLIKKEFMPYPERLAALIPIRQQSQA